MAPAIVLDQILELTLLLGEDTRQALAAEGLTQARTQVLWLIHHDGPMIHSDLAGRLRVSARNVTGLVDALAEQGLATRRPHPSDRRAALVVLTDRGAAIMRRMSADYQELYDVLFGPMSKAERERFSADLAGVLDRLRARLAEEAR